jgi:PAS domain S-box-containing protein
MSDETRPLIHSEKKGFSIFARLLIALLGVVILVSGVLTVVFYVYSKRHLERHTMEIMTQQFEAIDNRLHLELQDVLLNDLQILSSSPTVEEYLMSSLTEKEITARGVERLFRESMKYIQSYDSVYYVDALGNEAIKVDLSGRVSELRNISKSTLFKSIRSGSPGSIHFDVPRQNAEGRVVFSIGIHKLDPDIGKFGGAVIVDYNYDKFLEYVSHIRIFDKNPLWLFDINGQVLKQPQSEKAYFDPRPYFAAPVRDEPRLVQRDEGLLVYRDFYLLPEQPLLRLAISVPTSLMLGDIQALSRFILIVLLISIVVIFIIAYYLAGYFSRPIVGLAHAATRLAKGDLSTRVRKLSGGEFGLLVNSFNKMAEDLEKTTVSRDYVDDIIGSMRDSLIVTSGDGTITRMNMAACFLLGYDETELLGRPLNVVLRDQPGEDRSLLSSVLDGSSVNALEKTYVTKSGKQVPVLFSASVMREGGGAVKAIVCMAQDMSERKQDEEMVKAYSEELKVINEELKNFAYIISHDLRAPLVNIKGFSDELGRALGDIGPCFQKNFSLLDQADQEKVGPLIEQDIPEAIKYIGSSVNRMDSIINSVLKLSRAGRRKITPEPIMVKELVQNIEQSLAHQIGSRSVAVKIHNLPDVVTDRTALEQIFGNLLDNALKYLDAERAGEIEVFAEESSSEVVFCVRDNGRGIAEEDISRAFEIFRRVGPQDVPGEGLGLAYVKTIVRLLGGRIWCESELGKGSTFKFLLPRAREREAAH